MRNDRKVSYIIARAGVGKLHAVRTLAVFESRGGYWSARNPVHILGGTPHQLILHDLLPEHLF
jgi:hypothetical protein